MKPTEIQIDAITEMINIGIGRGANVLNTMFNSYIRLHVPIIKILSPEELKMELEAKDRKKRLSAVNLPFEGKLSGNAELIFPSESASHLVDIFTDEDQESDDLDSIRAGALCEIGNVVLNAVMGSLSNLLKLSFKYSVPNYLEGFIENLLLSDNDFSRSSILLAKTNFSIEELEIKGNIVLLFKMGSFDKLLTAVDNFCNSNGNNG